MELLICIADAGTRCKPGDVIAAMPDGWAWSEAERTTPTWRIVRADITEVEGQSLVFTEASARRLDVADLPQTLTRADLYARLA